ncbi:MAG: sensor histidine kinase, partial [Armatimonadota bacterium]
MVEALSNPVSQLLSAGAQFLLAALALVMAYNEWRRYRDPAFLYAGVAFTAVCFQQLAAALGAVLTLVWVVSMPPAVEPLRRAVELLAAVLLAYGFCFPLYRSRRWAPTVLIAGLAALTVLAGLVQTLWIVLPRSPALPFAASWGGVTFTILAVLSLVAATGAVWASRIHSRQLIALGTGLLALCIALKGVTWIAEALEPTAAALMVLAQNLPVVALASFVLAIYRNVLYENQRNAEALLAMQQDLAERQGELLVGSMARGIAHEITNPLSALLSHAALARRLSDEAKRDHSLAVVQEEGERLAQINERLRRFATRREEGAEVVDLAALVDDALQLAQFEVRRKRLRTRTAHAGSPLRVMAPPARLAQAVLNLLRECIARAQDGGAMEIATRTAEGWAVVHLRVESGGMSEEQRRGLLEPFATEDPAMYHKALAVFAARRVIEDLGGDLTISSRPGTGDTFTLRLPAT